jgi:Uncharacterized protein conserved in bacteria
MGRKQQYNEVNEICTGRVGCEMDFNSLDDAGWARWEFREQRRRKWKNRILIAVAAFLLLAYAAYTFPRDIRKVAGVRGGVTAVTISMETWDPAKGLKDSTTPFETILNTAEADSVSEVLGIFDDYRFRRKLSHRIAGYYEKTSELQIALRGSDGRWKFLVLASDGTFYTIQKGRNDYYHVGLAGSGKTAELFDRLTGYAKKHLRRDDVRLNISAGTLKNIRTE